MVSHLFKVESVTTTPARTKHHQAHGVSLPIQAAGNVREQMLKHVANGLIFGYRPGRAVAKGLL